MKPALLDTNVILALAWPNHQHHALAHRWFRAEARSGWATCALTQVGFVRLSSNPSFTSAAVTPQQAATLLQKLLAHEHHHFWASPQASKPGIYRQTLGHQQVNDAYLVEVARKQRGRLVTLDSKLLVHAQNEDLIFVIGA